MASNTPEIECEGPELRRLGSVRTIAIGVFVCTTALYDYAKQNHRLLTLPARLVEVPVKTVLGPVWNMFRNLPDDLVVLADILADNVAARYNAYAPSSVKRLVWPFNAVVRKLIHKAVIVANEAQARGPQAAARYVAVQSQKFVIKRIAKWWAFLRQYHLFRAWARLVLPGVACLCRKYNKFIGYATMRNYPLVGHLPAIPIDELAYAVRQQSLRVTWINVQTTRGGGVIISSPRYPRYHGYNSD